MRKLSKGITDIVAVVLLLMLIIAMVGFAWLWFARMTSNRINLTYADCLLNYTDDCGELNYSSCLIGGKNRTMTTEKCIDGTCFYVAVPSCEAIYKYSVISHG